MGKKGRKTRWRTLTITDEHSDSEDSNTTTSGHRVPKGYPQKSYYGRFSYSSQSTPTRRYQCDGTKSTRSSSTASENKITFNEDEYTRITTPRQDVLFKKGYLNKPKSYQSQTSTGNSTTSTGNSTGNGTPDHQSTDLEYESQFVFPNGFVDQNGIYFVNSFEPYPLMVYNPPTYYPQFTNVKSKRCSTGSLTESASPNNEEASQELSQSETPSNVSDFNPVYNVIYPGFYISGACQPQDAANQTEPRKVKKRRRRRPSCSKTTQEGTTSEYTEDSSDEVLSDDPELANKAVTEYQPSDEREEDKKPETEKQSDNLDKSAPTEEVTEQVITEEAKESKEEKVQDIVEENEISDSKSEDCAKSKYDLKPDAEEFVPMAYRLPETIPMEPNVQFIKVPSNFVPLPILNPMGDFNGQTFNAFIPHGIPINFIPQNYINFIPNYPNKTPNVQPERQTSDGQVEENVKETVEVPKNQIDIAKIVLKLEEAAKEQNDDTTHIETTVSKPNLEALKPSNRNFNVKNFKRNRYQKVELKPPDDTKKMYEDREARKTAWKQASPKKDSIQISPKPTFKNYSDTLKKPQFVQNACHDKNMEKLKTNQVTVNDVKSYVKVEPSVPKISNEWISVSSKKKRRNKNVEETEDFEDLEEKEQKAVNNDTIAVEEVLPAVIEVLMQPAVIPEILSPPVKEPENLEVEKETMQNETATKTHITEAPQEEIEKVPEKPVSKKKSKKNQKSTTKRVIIRDLDLSADSKEQIVATEIETVAVNSVEDVVNAVEATEEPKVEPPQEKIDVTNDEKKESPEKKSSKKKKKKIARPSVVISLSRPESILNDADDSYDFLLENSLLDESQEKTNIEVSQELDKMIQRGIYSSLEEKIKSLNIESNDNFFKSIINNISSRESSVEKSVYGKTPDFSKILTSPSQLSKLKPSPSAGFNVRLGECLCEETPTTTLQHEVLATCECKEDLYPITKAVKEWMAKTRENTPDVEIFKSPSTIFREFGEGPKEEQKNDTSTGLDDEPLHDCGKEDNETEIKRKTSCSSVEEGEDVLEVYESKYGRNEDFLKIRAEVEQKKAAGFPKHGNLPYRAICCSIM